MELGKSGQMKSVLGLMSGTSADGIDIAHIITDGVTVKDRLAFSSVPYSDEMCQMIKDGYQLAAKGGSAESIHAKLKQLSRRITCAHARAVQGFLTDQKLSPDDIDLIGFHGQTVTHRPDTGWTVQLGDGQMLADLVCIDVINDFRSYDMRCGGQGAPLVPIYHAALMREAGMQGQAVALINIGGVANITWLHLSNAGDVTDISSFDTGPGNALIDDWVLKHSGQKYDDGGAIAAKGIVQNGIVASLMSHGYFNEVPPKSLDRDQFDVRGLKTLNLEDGAATLTQFTAQSIIKAFDHFPVKTDRIYICGGGVHNKYMMQTIKSLAHCPVGPLSDIGFNGDSIEAEAFAFLAVRSLRGFDYTDPRTTGVQSPVSGGVHFQPQK